MILGYSQETSIPSVSPVLPSRFHAHGVKSQDFPKPTTLSRHLPRNRTFRTWTYGIIAAESDRLVFFKGTISGSMLCCIAFYDTEKILETMLFCCLAMRWSTFGPIVQQSQKKISTLVHVGSTTYPITSNFGGNGWKWRKPNATNLQLLMVYAYAFLASWEVNGDGFWHLIYHFPPTVWLSHETIACHP